MPTQTISPDALIGLRSRRISLACLRQCLWIGGVIFLSILWAPAQSTTSPGSDRGSPSAALDVPADGKTGFSLLAPEITKITFTNQLRAADLAQNQILEIGSGVALGDIDGDGWVDIYLCSLSGGNRLFRNLGNWRFKDITDQSGVDINGQFSTGAVFSDVDGDGKLDLLVNAIGGGTRLFRNKGAMRFSEARDAGLIQKHGSTSMALADINGDGYLDLYVANYHSRTFKDKPPGLEVKAGYVDGKFTIEPPGMFLPLPLKSGAMNLFERGESDVLYLNNGKGGFTVVDWTQGRFRDIHGNPLAEAPKDWGLAVAFRDLNGDGQPDLYVCNDFFNSPDRIWLNDGEGNFQAPSPFVIRHTSMSSMAVDFADLNRDGRDDFMVLDMLSREHQRRHRQRGSLVHLQVETPSHNPPFQPETPRNTLFVQRDDLTYAEIAQFSGIEASEWSWSVAFLDVDLDGFEDALITNGNIRDANDADLSRMSGPRMEAEGLANSKGNNLRFPPLETANLAFRNRGDLTFEEIGAAWGFATRGVSHGMAMADLDNDGDLDIVVNNLGEPAGIYRNNSSAPRVLVRLHGRTPNTQGIGARVELLGGALPKQSQEIMSGGRYLSGDDATRCFAAGSLTNRMELRITWRNGAQTIVPEVRANQRLEIQEPELPAKPSLRNEYKITGSKNPFFSDESHQLRHPHRENDFREEERQPLLTRELSRLGPGVTWKDLDADGREDLILGGSRNGFFIVYLNEGRGKFKPLRRKDALTRDQTSILAFTPSGSETLQILAGSSNYEDATTNSGLVISYDLQKGTETSLISDQAWSVGPLAMGAIDNTPCLFVGGRVQPGQYPAPTRSLLYQFKSGSWTLDSNATEALKQASLVSGATWADMDGDGSLELLTACEWGPIRVYRRRLAAWEDLTHSLRLDQYSGLWNGVAVGDFDEDGKLDFIATNWGRNTRYQRHLRKPVRLYYGDWGGVGQIAMSESYFEPAWGAYVPFLTLDRLRSAFPGVAERFPTFAAFARISMEELAAGSSEPMGFLQAEWLDTTLFLNRNDHFEARPLPAEAQWSPAFGVSIGDLDGDGHEDVFLSQNFSGTLTEECRFDSGQGLWLRGDGKGGLEPVSASKSGLIVTGDGRGTALCDYDSDGRTDLAVAQNNGPTRLFHNNQAQPGLRVSIKGAPGNRDGIGTVVRLKYPRGFGPSRCFQVGSGYWSQESSIQVLGVRTNERPIAISARWADGLISEQPLTATQQDVLIIHPTP